MGIHGTTGASPITPKVEDDHLAPVVGEFHLLAIDILADDFGSDFADGEVLGGFPFCHHRFDHFPTSNFEVEMFCGECFDNLFVFLGLIGIPLQDHRSGVKSGSFVGLALGLCLDCFEEAGVFFRRPVSQQWEEVCQLLVVEMVIGKRGKMGRLKTVESGRSGDPNDAINNRGILGMSSDEFLHGRDSLNAVRVVVSIEFALFFPG